MKIINRNSTEKGRERRNNSGKFFLYLNFWLPLMEKKKIKSEKFKLNMKFSDVFGLNVEGSSN